MIENEDKLLYNTKKIMRIKIFMFLKYVFNTPLILKSILEALLLNYIGSIQYGIYF